MFEADWQAVQKRQVLPSRFFLSIIDLSRDKLLQEFRCTFHLMIYFVAGCVNLGRVQVLLILEVEGIHFGAAV